MTSPSNAMITRCPKCGTAFRVTASQLQSAKGAVRCGSCLHVFKAHDHLVAAPVKITPAKATVNAAPANESSSAANAASATPKIPVIDKSSLDHIDDILISDDMDDVKPEGSKYDHDDFMEIAPRPEISLFERKQRDLDKDADNAGHAADESWAELLIEDDEDDVPQLGILKPKKIEPDSAETETETETETEAFGIGSSEISSLELENSTEILDGRLTTAPIAAPISVPSLKFSLVGEAETPIQASKTEDDLVLSEEFSRIPDQHPTSSSAADTAALDPSLFEEPAADNESSRNDEPSKRQVKTQPKIRAYDNSRSTLLTNIIPAPIEFTAKRMHRWYQRKLWLTLSFLALILLVIQIGWFKFDYFSRVEPYRTGYLFLCPYIGCQVPTLVDTRRILASNLSVRINPEIPDSLKVDVLIINNAPFDQPFPDLELVFTDINENPVAARRFTPDEYLGGELAGRKLMPQNQKIYISLDLVDPGESAVNYSIQIIGNQ
jgi:predicted Zn finger-like uncharacterized protein